MLKRRQLLVGAVAVAGAGGAAWLYYRSRASQALGGGPFRHYPFDPVAAENFQQKLFIPVASGPFGVLDVAKLAGIKRAGSPGSSATTTSVAAGASA